MTIKRFTTREEKAKRRHLRVRAKISGTENKPRLSVFKSNRHLFVQLIDDLAGKTLVSVSDKEVKVKKTEDGFAGVARAEAVGKLLAEKALAEKIQEAVFDRGAKRYTGQIKAVAEGARAGGLKI